MIRSISLATGCQKQLKMSGNRVFQENFLRNLQELCIYDTKTGVSSKNDSSESTLAMQRHCGSIAGHR